MTTTIVVRILLCVIFATALMAGSSHGRRHFFDCKPVDSLDSLMAVTPAGRYLTMGPLGLYAIVSEVECYLLHVKQQDFEQQHRSLLEVPEDVAAVPAAVEQPEDNPPELLPCGDIITKPNQQYCQEPCQPICINVCGFNGQCSYIIECGT
jgi:hypothetical protein